MGCSKQRPSEPSLGQGGLPQAGALTPSLLCPERNLRDLVTIATKTFLRPNKLMVLLRSIRDYYPDLTVIVADDSKKPLDIQDKHVEYYTMPFGKVRPSWSRGPRMPVLPWWGCCWGLPKEKSRVLGDPWETQIQPPSLVCLGGPPFLRLGGESDGGGPLAGMWGV